MTNQLNLGSAYSLASSNYSYIDYSYIDCVGGGGGTALLLLWTLTQTELNNVYVTGQNYIQVKIFQPRLIFNLAVSPSLNYLWIIEWLDMM